MSTTTKNKRAKSNPIETRSTLISPIDKWLTDALGGGATTASRQIVNAKSALGVPAWLSAIKVISEDVAKLRIKIYKRANNSSIELPDHDLIYLMNSEPNEDMSAMSFWETLVAHALAWSGGYAEIIRDGAGRPIGMYPLDPCCVTPIRDQAGKLVYRVQSGNGYIILQQSQVFHLHGLSFDGIHGYDVANLAKEIIGNALSANQFSGSFFGNGANIGGFISTCQRRSESAVNQPV